MPCYTANEFHQHRFEHPQQFWEHKFFVFGISSVTSCHFLVSARKKRWRGEAPKIADSVTELMVKRQQLTFIKQKPTHFHIFLPPCQSVHKRSWNEETGTPSNLSLSSKRRAAPGKSCIYSIRQINAKRP